MEGFLKVLYVLENVSEDKSTLKVIVIGNYS